ncbi:MAG: DUF2244 domain-containing protein [Acetobacteraceae bacterium]|nr:DUF2244 domain-containing protein [Acetobacteraceae bacterium]
MAVGREQAVFSATLVAQRSLGGRGLLAVALILAGSAAAVAGLFLVLGAWPVVGFVSLEVGAALALFLGHHALARVVEEVVLEDRVLRVSRRRGFGAAQAWEFPPGWLRVTVEPPGPRSAGGVVLSSHGRSLVLGSGLTEDEREEFAEALREALRRWRSPGLAVGG